VKEVDRLVTEQVDKVRIKKGTNEIKVSLSSSNKFFLMACYRQYFSLGALGEVDILRGDFKTLALA
jgi:hypothetical protein